MKTKYLIPFLTGLSIVAGIVGPSDAGPTLDAIKARGVIKCGVSPVHSQHKSVTLQYRSGLDRLTCHALAAAVLGDREKIEFVPVSAKLRFKGLQNKSYDVLIRGTTWTLKRDTALGLHFAGVNLYDGQGFIARSDLAINEITEVKGGTICVETNTTSLANIEDFIAQHGLDIQLIRFQSFKEAKAAFFSGRCNLYSADRATLAAVRLTTAPRPDDFVVLPDIISKEPLGPVVRDDDTDWFRITKWVLNALIETEEKNITSKNVGQMLNSGNPSIRRLLGAKPGIGKPLGLDDQWVRRVVTQVGNYGEIYAVTMGHKSKMALPRGLNALWKDGGLMYAPPLR